MTRYIWANLHAPVHYAEDSPKTQPVIRFLSRCGKWWIQVLQDATVSLEGPKAQSVTTSASQVELTRSMANAT